MAAPIPPYTISICLKDMSLKFFERRLELYLEYGMKAKRIPQMMKRNRITNIALRHCVKSILVCNHGNVMQWNIQLLHYLESKNCQSQYHCKGQSSCQHNRFCGVDQPNLKMCNTFDNMYICVTGSFKVRWYNHNLLKIY